MPWPRRCRGWSSLCREARAHRRIDRTCGVRVAIGKSHCIKLASFEGGGLRNVVEQVPSQSTNTRGNAAGVVLCFGLLGPWIGVFTAAPATFGLSLFAIAYPPLAYMFGGVPAIACGLFAAWYRPRATRGRYVWSCAGVGLIASLLWFYGTVTYEGGIGALRLPNPDQFVGLLGWFGLPGMVAATVCALVTRPRHDLRDSLPPSTDPYDCRRWTG